MPSGKTHDAISWYLLIPFACLCWYFSKDIFILFLFCISYLFSSFMFGGDLDLVSVQSKRWGNFRWIWIPYRKMFSHRSKFSHGILIGTIFRIFYFSIICLFFYTIFYFISKSYLPEINKELLDTTQKSMYFVKKQPLEYFIAIFLGLLSGDFLHTFSDVTLTKLKRLSRKLFSKKKKKRKN